MRILLGAYFKNTRIVIPTRPLAAGRPLADRGLIAAEDQMLNRVQQDNCILEIVSIVLFFLVLFAPMHLAAQPAKPGTVSGVIKSDSSGRALEFVNVVLLNPSDSSIVTGTVTDAKGVFDIDNVPSGAYLLKTSLLGFTEKRPVSFSVDGTRQRVDLGTILLVERALSVGDVTVTSQRTVFNNAIDRKVYNVQQDVMSKTGTAGDLLQNIPSVQVDLDGTVSLRGSSNVLILVNGKPSPLMTKNSADVLQQMPANTIERIEVITNPSAKFKPDGTSGIINLVIKKETKIGLNGSVAANAGNKERYNGTVSLNYHPGDLNVFGSYSIRQDDRNNFSTDHRTMTDTATGTLTSFQGNSVSRSRPRSHVIKLGADYRFNETNSAGISGNYLYRGLTRKETTTKRLMNAAGTIVSDYDRIRDNPEFETETGVEGYVEHLFDGEDHKIRLEFSAAYTPEEEDNHNIDLYRIPVRANEYDNTLIKQIETNRQVQIDYSNPLGEHSSMEAGYTGDFNKRDMDYRGEAFDAVAGRFVVDHQTTNRFLYNENIHALYGTYEHSFGAFSVMGGLRLEASRVTSDMTNLDSVIQNNTTSFYPTLHLAYALNEGFELQLNYSRRTNRPEGDDLNPFPEYQDPRNIRAGNPNLKAEMIHSIEVGVQLQNDNITVVSSLFYRNKYNGFTMATRPLNDSTLLTTWENLATDRSAGLEFVVAGNLGSFVSANASANAFYEEIDASNLGFSGTKSTVTWSGTLNCNMNLMPGMVVQVNSNYRSSRLTPQGETQPSYVVNLGMRQDLFDDQLSVILTASDLFRTLKRTTEFKTDWMKQTVVSNRDSQIFYFGLTYHFGRAPKKSNDKSLQYDNAL